MERRMLLAVLLSFAVVSFYMAMTGQCQSPPPKDDTTTNGEKEPGSGDPAAPGNGGQPTPEPGPGDPVQPPPPEAPQDTGWPTQPADLVPKLHTVTAGEFRVTFTERGGAVEAIQLLHAFEQDSETPLDIVVPFADDQLLGQIDDTLMKPKDGAPGTVKRRDDPAGPMRTLIWKRDEKAEADTPDLLDAVYTLTRNDGTVWKKQWVLSEDRDRYDLHLNISRKAAAGAGALPPARVKVLVTSGLFREPSTGAAFQYPNGCLLRLAREDEAADLPHGVSMPDVDDVDPDDLRLLGVRTHYFLSAYYAHADDDLAPEIVRWWGTGEDAKRREEMRNAVSTFFRDQRGRDPKKDEVLRARIREGVMGLLHTWVVVDVPTKTDATAVIPIYVGPIDRPVLRQDEYAAVKPVIKYPFAPDILADALLAIYDLFRNLLGNAGVAVILMTLVVRGAMMPLSIRNQLSMRQYSRKIAKVKPKLDAIKKKFGSNLKKLREEQAKLYREHGIGFPTGCLMLLIQMPIFFALFSSLRTEYSLRGEAFLWITDLSGPDKLIDFGGTSIDLFVLTLFSINLLPLLMVALSVWQQRLMPKPADEQQAQQMRMMKWLPIIFAVILYNYTAALALYMVLSSAVAIAESRIVRYKDKDATEEAAAAAAGAWPPAKE